MSWNLPYIIREYALLRGNAGPVSTKTISTMLSIKEWISVVLQWLSGCLSNKIKWQSRKPPAGWFSGHRSLRSRLRGAGLRTDFLQYLKTLLLPTCIVPFSSIPPGSKQAGVPERHSTGITTWAHEPVAQWARQESVTLPLSRTT